MKKVWKVTKNIEEYALVVAFAVQIILTFLNVVSRKLLPNVRMAYTEELTLILLIWIVMLGASICFRDHSHLGLSLIYDRLPPTGQIVLSILSSLLSYLVAGVLIVMGFTFAKGQLVGHFETAALGINLSVASSSLPICGCLFVVRITQGLLHDLKQIREQKGNNND